MIEIRPLTANYLQHPRRVMKYVLIWCAEGSLTLAVDENTFELQENQVITITSGQYHYIKDSAGAKGHILEFTYDFFCNNDNDIELIFHNGLFCHFAMNEVISIDYASLIRAELGLIEKEITEKPYQYLLTIHSRIELILVEINRAKISHGDEIWKPDALFLKFLETIRGNFSKNLSVGQIASLLHTTESKLNELSKLHTGKTAQNVIYGLIISEAKRLFTYEKMAVKEVAYNLGFNDPFYFSNFFKKFIKISPKSYKESMLSK
ncbi:helix-turn-helix domain-containing protein [Flavobacterium sp.]|uniref:helix-turn-helix domain-containing protein n=1 Tax=Flavobacterium sp. TaxID=239 RepID=UPI003D6AE3B3